MPTRTSGTTRDAILDATTQLIGEHGVDGFTISDVAKRARINRSLIYHYYRDRDNLLYEAVRSVIDRAEPFSGAAGVDDVVKSAQLQIDHPEIARFFFHLLLDGRQLPGLTDRLLAAIERLEQAKQEIAPDSYIDPTMAALHLSLSLMAWAIAREEMARHLGISLEEADRRWIAHVRHSSETVMEAIRSR